MQLWQAQLRAARTRGAASWWTVAGKTCVGAWLAKGAASQATSYSNLASPGTYDLTVNGNAPSWDAATGWTFAGSHGLSTGVVIGAVTWSACVRIANPATVGHIAGSYMGGGRFEWENYSGKRYYWNTASSTTAGVFAAGVVGLAGHQGYRNGAADLMPTTGNTLPTAAFNLGRLGGVAAYYTGDILAACIYSDTLSEAEMAALYTAMMAL